MLGFLMFSGVSKQKIGKKRVELMLQENICLMSRGLFRTHYNICDRDFCEKVKGFYPLTISLKTLHTFSNTF